MHFISNIKVNGRAEILIDLLSHFDDLELEDEQGQTPLHVASQNGHKKVSLCGILISNEVQLAQILDRVL